VEPAAKPSRVASEPAASQPEAKEQAAEARPVLFPVIYHRHMKLDFCSR